MTKGIMIGEAVMSLLLKGKVLPENIIMKRIFPLINTDEKVEFPYIVYSNTDISPDNTKDGCYIDNLTVEIVVVDTDYMRMLTIANNVRNAMEYHKYESETANMRQCRLNGCTETYDDNAQAFIKRLIFSMKSE